MDSKIVQIKKETDIDVVKVMVNKKADLNWCEKTNKESNKLLQKNTIEISQIRDEMRQAQSLVYSVYQACKELQEANKDVLMGRRRLDCLSCGDVDYHSTKNSVTTTKKPNNDLTPLNFAGNSGYNIVVSKTQKSGLN